MSPLNKQHRIWCLLSQCDIFATYTHWRPHCICFLLPTAVVDVNAFRDLEWGSALNPVIISLALCIDTNPKRVQEKTLTRQASLNIYCVWPPSTTHTTNTRRSFAFSPSFMPCVAVALGGGETLRWTFFFFFFSSFLLLADNHRLWAGLWCVMMLNINVWRWLLR